MEYLGITQPVSVFKHQGRETMGNPDHTFKRRKSRTCLVHTKTVMPMAIVATAFIASMERHEKNDSNAAMS